MAMETTARAWNSSEISTAETSTQPAQNAMRSMGLLVEISRTASATASERDADDPGAQHEVEPIEQDQDQVGEEDCGECAFDRHGR